MFSISDIFWSPKFWLPSKLTWNDLEINGKSVMPSCWDLLMCIPVTLLIFFIRYLWEILISVPLSRLYPLKEKNGKNTGNGKFMSNGNGKCGTLNYSEEFINMCIKENSWSRRQVERYIRNYKKADVSAKIRKFTECSWLFIFYSSIFGFGVWCMWDKKWLINTSECWVGWPFEHHMPREIFWYYIIQMSFYLSLIFSLYFDVKRKDFLEMAIHHVATVLLLFLSYCNNFYRMGCLVLLLHDPCDVILQVVKMAKYLKCQRICDSCFVIFSAMWLVTRLLIFPMKILYSCFFEAPLILNTVLNCPSCTLPYIYYAMNGMFCVLQVLHIIWFCFIIKAVKGALDRGGVQKDSRSETESNDSTDNETNSH